MRGVEARQRDAIYKNQKLLQKPKIVLGLQNAVLVAFIYGCRDRQCHHTELYLQKKIQKYNKMKQMQLDFCSSCSESGQS